MCHWGCWVCSHVEGWDGGWITEGPGHRAAPFASALCKCGCSWRGLGPLGLGGVGAAEPGARDEGAGVREEPLGRGPGRCGPCSGQESGAQTSGLIPISRLYQAAGLGGLLGLSFPSYGVGGAVYSSRSWRWGVL